MERTARCYWSIICNAIPAFLPTIRAARNSTTQHGRKKHSPAQQNKDTSHSTQPLRAADRPRPAEPRAVSFEPPHHTGVDGFCRFLPLLTQPSYSANHVGNRA